MKIIARCHPELEPILPKPVPATEALPLWLKQMPAKVAADTLGGEEVRTLKHCLPFIDALSVGVLIPLATDLDVHNGELSWDWDPPILEDANVSRSPIGVHVPEQATGAPVGDDRLIIKFINFWTLEVPEKWQLLFLHPLNQPDLPFNTLSGVVDCNSFRHGYVHFPALLDRDFEGTIPAGTPVAQVVPVPKEAVEVETQAMSPQLVEQSRLLQENLQRDTGVYRKLSKL